MKKEAKKAIAVWRLDEHRYALSVDNVVRYVGSQEECERRAELLIPRCDRERQDRALMRACGF
jgi:hypothetical protein